MADNQTPYGFITYPNKGDTSWYSNDTEGDGLEDWLAAIEELGVPTFATFADLPTAGTTAVDGEQRQFAAVAGDRTVYRDDGTSWVPWFGAGTSGRRLPDTTYHNSTDTTDLDIGGSDFVASGDYVTFPAWSAGGLASVSSNTYTNQNTIGTTRVYWDLISDGGDTAIALSTEVDPGSDQIDVRLQNTTDSETILEKTGVTTAKTIKIGPSAYTPTTTSDHITIEMQFRNSDNSTSVDVNRSVPYYGIQL